MSKLDFYEIQYLKAIGLLADRRRQLADISVDSNLTESLRARLSKRLDKEIAIFSRGAEDALEGMKAYENIPDLSTAINDYSYKSEK